MTRNNINIFYQSLGVLMSTKRLPKRVSKCTLYTLRSYAEVADVAIATFSCTPTPQQNELQSTCSL